MTIRIGRDHPGRNAPTRQRALPRTVTKQPPGCVNIGSFSCRRLFDDTDCKRCDRRCCCGRLLERRGAREIKISPFIDDLAMSTGTYISQARACKTDEWKPILRESIIEVKKRERSNDLRYFQLVVEWANRYEALGCDQTTLLTIRQAQQASLDRFIRTHYDSRCKLAPHLVC